MSLKAYGVGMAQRKRAGFAKFRHLVATALMAIMPLSGVMAEPITMLALGDSLTAGYGLDQGRGFVPQLEAWLRKNGKDINLVNGGVSGDTTAGGYARLGWSLSDEVDMVMVNLGGNDMLRGLPPSETRRNLAAIMAELEGRDLPVILIRVPGSLNFGPDDKAAYDAIFPDLAQQHQALFIPNFFAALEEQAEAKAAMQDLMQPDGLHPTARGISLIVEQIGPQVLDWINKAENSH
ncbi:arylesterase [Aliiroseovarius crassostreae]|uniref:arylesterase n=1 Tax=Aliiroseovarius crassostreae TaxID=154981 RepID=UPI003C7EC676